MDIDVFLHNLPDINMALKLFFILIGLDFVSGSIKAIKNNCFQSCIMKEGIYKSIGEILIAFIIFIIGYYVHGLTEVLNFVIYILCLKELASIIENLLDLNVWIPKFIKNFINEKIDKIDKGE